MELESLFLRGCLFIYVQEQCILLTRNLVKNKNMHCLRALHLENRLWVINEEGQDLV